MIANNKNNKAGKKPFNYAYILLLSLTIIVAGSKMLKSYFGQDKKRQANVPKYEVNNGPKRQDHSLPDERKPSSGHETKDQMPNNMTYLPSSKGEVVVHQFYTLSYLEKYEQAEWVCYPLTKEILKRPNVPRSDWFNPDPMVSTQSASHFDYKGSGYTRGHMVPAGDMSFDPIAMEETFYMSNMSPQLRGFNNGIWRELEEQTRDWIYQNNEVLIVSGPIIGTHSQFFKKKHIAIPTAFYKIILDTSQPEVKAIAFIIPHEISIKPLSAYAVSIDEVEKATGIDFFEKYIPHSIEKIESSFDIHKWPVSEARFKLRVDKWNNE
jgi:endonuclease G, mitochondrial